MADKKALSPATGTTYKRPQLTCYGNIADITRTRSGNLADNFQANCNHQGPNTNPVCQGPIS